MNNYGIDNWIDGPPKGFTGLCWCLFRKFGDYVELCYITEDDNNEVYIQGTYGGGTVTPHALLSTRTDLIAHHWPVSEEEMIEAQNRTGEEERYSPPDKD